MSVDDLSDWRPTSTGVVVENKDRRHRCWRSPQSIRSRREPTSWLSIIILLVEISLGCVDAGVVTPSVTPRAVTVSPQPVYVGSDARKIVADIASVTVPYPGERTTSSQDVTVGSQVTTVERQNGAAHLERQSSIQTSLNFDTELPSSPRLRRAHSSERDRVLEDHKEADSQLDRLHHYVISVPLRVDERGSTLPLTRHATSAPDPDDYVHPVLRRRNRSKRSAAEVDDVNVEQDGTRQTPKSVYYRLSAYGREFFFNLTRNDRLAAPGLSVEYWSRDGLRHRRSTVESIDVDGGCHYVGHVIDGEGKTSNVAISDCFGLQGVFTSRGDEFIVEPLRNETVTSLDDSSGRSTATYHVVYRRSAIKSIHADSHCGLQDGAAQSLSMSLTSIVKRRRRIDGLNEFHAESDVELRSRQPSSGKRNRRNRSRQRRSVSRESHVETLVVIDREMINYHGERFIEPYVLTIMNIVAKLYRDASLGNAINIVVSRIIVLNDDQPGLEISYHADKTLESFCRWQHRINAKSTNSVIQNEPGHDNAILLTRYDICTYKNQPCGTLGLAPVAGMCEPDRSCSLTEDVGLASAFTIAHELGHNFGMQHDGSGNKCGTPGHEPARIMAGQLAKNKEPFSWSSCSRDYITNFLNSGRGQCLENVPSERPMKAPDLSPGQLHDANTQCRYQFGSSSVQCKQHEDVCRTLWCINNEGQCVTNYLPAVEGTSCSNGNVVSGWCYQGRCRPKAWKPKALDGQWGQWSPWGDCSRTCGGGVEASERQCDNPRPVDGGKFCIGQRQRYRSCNIQDCPVNSTDVREVQCAKFNSESFRNQYYKWKPFNGVNQVRPCALNCMAVGYNFYTERAAKVMDGTPCYPDSPDICINGECQHVGCDRILGSTAVEDKCRVCGGDGVSCQTVKGAVDVPMDKEGDLYVEVVRIPRGAVHIQVAEAKISKNYLALKSGANDSYYINGAWTIDWPRKFKVADTVFHYERPKDREESFSALGPISEDLAIMVLVQEHSLAVEYVYNVVDDVMRSTTAASIEVHYVWTQSEWTTCSASCAGGVSRSYAVCTSRIPNQRSTSRVDDRFCDSRTRPAGTVRSCNERQCPPEWSVGEWSVCSRTCGGRGLRTRSVLCVVRRASSLTLPPTVSYPSSSNGSRTAAEPAAVELVELARCGNKRPKNRMKCGQSKCPPRWAADDWSECRPLCGAGVRLRNVFCMSDDGSTVPSSHCNSSLTPTSFERCSNDECPQPKWTTGAWGECSVSCGFGHQMRSVACRTYAGEPSTSCSDGTRPEYIRDCHQLCAAAERRRGKERNISVTAADCRDVNQVNYCPLVIKFRLCDRAYFRQLCCRTCTDAGL